MSGSQSGSQSGSLSTELTKLFKIKHPVLLAGMNVAAGSELAAAVTNAGGMGVIGGIGYSPQQLREEIQDLKSGLKEKDAPFGVDLLIPMIGGTARKTNTDYTRGQLPELIDVIIEEKAALFVCAVGVPPKWAVEKLHKAGIVCMNMIGHPKHVQKALDVGVDIICAQGGEGGGHTGDVPTFLLIPAVADLVKGKKSPLTGNDVLVVAAGGVYDGRGLASALMMGASGVWVGTRFVCAEEAGAPAQHQKEIMSAGWEDTIRTIIFTGRPLRVKRTPFIDEWETRQEEIKKITSEGKLPVGYDSEERSFLMGRVSALINDVKPAKQIVEEMVAEAVEQIKKASAGVGRQARL